MDVQDLLWIICVCWILHPTVGSIIQGPVMPPAFMYVVNGSICHVTQADVNSTASVLAEKCVLYNRNQSINMALSAQKEVLYFSSNKVFETTIVQKSLTNNLEKTIVGVSGYIGGLALDWTSGNLYWTEPSSGRVMMTSTVSGRHKYSLQLINQLSDPTAIVLDPYNRHMYCLEAGVPRVFRVLADGSQIFSFLSSHQLHGRPAALAIDIQRSRIFWSVGQKVHSVNFNGGDDLVIASLPTGPILSIAPAQDMVGLGTASGLYWVSYVTGHVTRRMHESASTGHIVYYSSYSQSAAATDATDTEGACGVGDVSCTQLCLPSPLQPGRSCACSFGYSLLADRTSCDTDPTPPTDDVLLVLDTGLAEIFHMPLGGAAAHVLPVTHQGLSFGLAYNNNSHVIYWADLSGHSIQQASRDGGEQTTVAELERNARVESLVHDPLHQALYFTIYVGRGNGSIARVDVNGGQRETWLGEGLERPRGLLLDPHSRYLYWTDWGSSPRIERALLHSATQRQILVNTDLVWPNAITADFPNNQLFWCDAKLDKVEMSDLFGRGRRVLLQEASVHYFGLALDANYLYVTDWSSRFIKRLRRSDSRLETWGLGGFVQPSCVLLLPARPPTTSASRSQQEMSSLDMYMFIGIGAASGVVLIIVIIVIAVFARRRCRRKEMPPEMSSAERTQTWAIENPGYLARNEISEDVKQNNQVAARVPTSTISSASVPHWDIKHPLPTHPATSQINPMSYSGGHRDYSRMQSNASSVSYWSQHTGHGSESPPSMTSRGGSEKSRSTVMTSLSSANSRVGGNYPEEQNINPYASLRTIHGSAVSGKIYTIPTSRDDYSDHYDPRHLPVKTLPYR